MREPRARMPCASDLPESRSAGRSVTSGALFFAYFLLGNAKESESTSTKKNKKENEPSKVETM